MNAHDHGTRLITLSLLLLLTITYSNAIVVNERRVERIDAKGSRHFTVHNEDMLSKLVRKDVRARLRERTTTRQDSDIDATPDAIVEPLGYVFDPCIFNNDCAGNRTCIRADSKGDCDGAFQCYCVNPLSKEQYEEFEVDENEKAFLYQKCNKCKECDFYPEETCLLPHSAANDEEGICGSSYTVYEGILKETDCNSYPDVTPYLPGGFDENENGNVIDKTKNDGTNFYTNSKSTNVPFASPSPSPMQTHSTTATQGDPSGNSNDAESSKQNKCISVHHLAHLSYDNLVFNQHSEMNVLCDGNNSCATPGHIIIHNNSPMTMKSYCNQKNVHCSSKRSLVNSPSFSKGLRIHSNTKNLYFTSFSASYETKLEESFLKLLVHVGL